MHANAMESGEESYTIVRPRGPGGPPGPLSSQLCAVRDAEDNEPGVGRAGRPLRRRGPAVPRRDPDLAPSASALREGSTSVLSHDPRYSRADNKSARPERKGPLQIEIVSAAMGKAMQAWAWALKVIPTPPPRMFRTENR